jgi:hypothetical protein
MNTVSQRTCPSCGNEFAGAMEFCPVCMLRKGLAGGVASGEYSSEEAVKPTSEQVLQRFEHYRLVTDEDGKPVELGRGAMGVTYKAFDVDLHCAVTLKSSASDISEMNRRGFVFCARPGRLPAFATQTSPRSSTSEGPATITSTQWSLWRGKRSKISSNAQADWT